MPSLSARSATAAELRGQLLAMARQPDPYPFISAVEAYLAEVPEDHGLRGQAIKAMAGKGLLSVAVEVGQGCPPAGPEGAQLLAAVEQLAAVPNEIIRWARTDERFEANLEALRSRGPAGQDLATQMQESWKQISTDFTLHRANDGNLLVRGSRSDGRRIWIPAALDFAGKIEVVSNAGSLKGICAPPFLVDGVGLGWWLPRLYDISRNTYLNYSCAIYLVETNLRALALVLRLHDWSAALADERTYLFAGPSAWERWREVMTGNLALPLPRELSTPLRWPGQVPSPASQTVSEVVEYRRATLAGLRGHAEDLYAGRDVAWWANRYATAGPDDPLRILCVTSRFTSFLKYSMRDVVAALDRAGMGTQFLMEPNDHGVLSPHAYMEAFVEFQPDLVVMIDHHRPEQPQCFLQNVPCVCWIQDPLPNLMSEKAGRSLGPLDFVFGYYGPRCVSEFGYPADRFFYAPVPVAEAMFRDDAVDPAETRTLACDVVYVGHLNQTVESLRAQWRAEQPREVHPLLEVIDQRVDGILRRGEHLCEHYSVRNPTPFITDLAAQIGCQLAPGQADRIFSFYAYRAFDIAFRLQTLRWVARWARDNHRTFRIYGNGWQAVSDLASCAMGPIEHGEQLRKAYRSAKFAIQTIPAGFRHQRTLEAIAGGCLVLSRYLASDFSGLSIEETRRRREAGEHLPGPTLQRFPELDLVSFTTEEEFAELIQGFLQDEDRQHTTYQRFRERVLDEFTYDRVIAGVIRQIGQALRQQAGTR